LGDLGAAERHFQASLSMARETRHDWGEAYALAGLARAALALQQRDEAREHLGEALTRVRKFAVDGVLMLVLTGIAELYEATGAPEQAYELASLVVTHPMSWHETKARARRTLAATEHLVGPSAAQLAPIEPGDLWPMVEQLQASLARGVARAVPAEPAQQRAPTPQRNVSTGN